MKLASMRRFLLLLVLQMVLLPPAYAGRSFNGSSDVITVPSTGNALDISSGPETISFWFYPTVIPVSGSHYPLSNYGTNGQFAIGFGACALSCSAAGVLGFVEGTFATLTGVFGGCGTYTANQWYQVIYYVDTAGTLQGSPTAGIIVSGGTSCNSIQGFREKRVSGIGQFTIGGITGSADFQGTVAEVTVWNTLLSASQFTALQTVCPNGGAARRFAFPKPVYSAPLWGSSGTASEADLSGNKFNGTRTGTAQANHAPCTP